MTRISTIIILAAMTISAATGAEEPPDFIGQWVVNTELSEQEQPKKKKSGGGGFFPNLSVGGIYVPLPGSGGEGGGTPIKTPDAVYAKQVTISQQDKNILVKYHKLGEATYVAGNIQGTKTRWNQTKLTSGFSATSASVKETFEVKRDGRLYITVKINPKSGATRTFKRVFDRDTGDPEAAPEDDSS